MVRSAQCLQCVSACFSSPPLTSNWAVQYLLGLGGENLHHLRFELDAELGIERVALQGWAAVIRQ